MSDHERKRIRFGEPDVESEWAGYASNAMSNKKMRQGFEQNPYAVFIT